MNTHTYTEQLMKPEEFLRYKATKHYSTSNFKCVRLIETEFGRYVATNKFMHGVEDDANITQTTIS